MTVLAIESSCDETSAAIMSGADVRSNIISSQIIHTQYGGVIPELASRAHIDNISVVVEEALTVAHCSLEDIDAIATTTQPGLTGALLVGANFAKGLSLQYNIPCVPVNHIEGHIYSGYLENPLLPYPSIVLVASGGHTSLFHVTSATNYTILGSTRDDAAGEAFDKTAKMLGLKYPGGPLVDSYAQSGNARAIAFPRPIIHDKSYEFSFSGMKTAVRRYVHEHHPNGVSKEALPDICASLQEAIVDVLVSKTFRAVKEYTVKGVAIAGGVSANSRLRAKMQEEAAKRRCEFVAPRLSYSVDNAAMIGYVAQLRLKENGIDPYLHRNFEVHSTSLRMFRNSNLQPI